MGVASDYCGRQAGDRQREDAGGGQRRCLEKVRQAEVGLDTTNLMRQAVKACLAAWLDTVSPKLALTAKLATGRFVRLHLEPELGRYELSQLTAQHVDAMLRRKENAGLSSTSVAYIRTVRCAECPRGQEADSGAQRRGSKRHAERSAPIGC
ncbi:MAG: hypothetical protein R2853_03090 [Thermomicrobiales bacterium]